MRELIYLDHNATTPVLPEVVDAMLPYLREHFGNPSSSHVFGQRARAAVESARVDVAGLLECDAGEVVFTSGGTEASNLAIRGVAEARRDRRHVVTTTIEHPATAEGCAWLEAQGWRVTRANVDAGGRVLVEEVGVRALPITTLIGILIGVILAFGGALQLQKLGVQIFVADVVGVAVAQEAGALMTAILLAGRTGAAFAAQLGSMQVKEEIDALTTAGISPVQFLVLPRVLALVLMTPVLTIYADLFAMLGGGLVAITILDLSVTAYVVRLVQVVSISDFGMGLVRASVFGVLIAMAGCFRGMQSGRSASAVGLAATSAVVTSIVLTIIADGLLSVIFHLLRL